MRERKKERATRVRSFLKADDGRLDLGCRDEELPMTGGGRTEVESDSFIDL